MPTAAKTDTNSRTYDNARGGTTVKWNDSFNQKHEVSLGPSDSVTVIFPVFGGEWTWYQGDGSL
jgi:hypothetical protein